MTAVNIRPAKKEDMAAVFNLIKELADFEKMSDQVRINEKVLIKDGFESSSPLFTSYVAEIDNTIIGYAIYYIRYCTWVGKSVFLQDLYVDPNYRKQSVGKKLFCQVAKDAYEIGGQLDFHVLSWNPAIEFYKGVGAEDLTNNEQWHLLRLDQLALTKLFE
ncbi:diamine n-acetyltransferase [Holotrichia oblita]|uniref:Diamine n-acetyltransferase n=1 Tax=Holotrichia oblita TaxID=644536 RepID=A0ACB9TCP1_HOLOL|nr:diamine n-acetyltransferase [Holotrichia oblita]